MGISAAEVCALKYSDFDFNNQNLIINKKMSLKTSNKGAILETEERRLPIPQAVRKDYNRVERNENCYVLTDTEVPIESAMSAGYLLKRVLSINPELRSVTPDELQMTFIRRAVESGVDAQTIEAITAMPWNTVNRRFGKYAKPDTLAIKYISEKYTGTQKSNSEMNLLILGAGSHGRAVYEIAVKLGVFQKIKFLDDNISGENIIGKTDDVKRFRDQFNCCFVAIGNNEIRCRLGELAISLNYIIPRIISPEASIANNDVEIGIGTVVFPQANVNLGSHIGKFNILASNSMIGFEATTGDYVHCDSGSILGRKSVVPDMTTVETGEIVRA